MLRLLQRVWRWFCRCVSLRPEGFVERASLAKILADDCHVFRGASGQEYTILLGDPDQVVGDVGYIRKLPDHGLEFVPEDADLDDLRLLKDL